MKIEFLNVFKSELMKAVGNNTMLFNTFLIAMWILLSVLYSLDLIEHYSNKNPAWKQELKPVVLRIISLLGIVVLLIIV